MRTGSLGRSGAHPRSRGENGLRIAYGDSAAGSSPLTRGKQHRRRLRLEGQRLIPAHAGKTASTAASPGGPTAHPRSRGENIGDASAWRPQVGSSPLTRGKHQAVPAPGLAGGLIPAHAGKTSAYPRLPAASRAHPRSRGENHPLLQEQDGVGGSSPLTRGKPRTRSSPSARAGLIPAHAGKTMRSWIVVADEGAHPRSRGENGCGRRPRVSVKGSSPLTRGKHAGARARPHAWGLIPAHAGKTYRHGGAASALGAHPRSRGENGRFVINVVTMVGSSPLTRGKPTPRER